MLRVRAVLLHSAIHILSHLRLLLRWVLLSVLMGILAGMIGTVFSYLISAATLQRQTRPWIIALLPAAGLLIVWLYHITKDDQDRGTNMVLASLRAEAELPFQMAPLIFISTVLSHLTGASVGREGAALQLGGGLGSTVGRGLKLHEKDKQVLILCGMSAAFSAIFRTPIAAPVFSMEVGIVGTMHYAAIVPCTIASLTASWIAGKCGLPLAHYTVTRIPSLEPLTAGKVLLLSVILAGISILFCVSLHTSEHLMGRIRNPYLRILAGAGGIWLILLLVRNQDYIGVGSEIIHGALAGKVVWYAFILKILTTSLSLGGGYKGGEIVPTFFIGATAGCLLGQILHLSPSFCAAVGMVALFCGVTNCPLASLLISIELFGTVGMPYYLLAIAICYLLSGYYGLYGEQHFSTSKYRGTSTRHGTRR